MDYNIFKQKILKEVLKEHGKEYACHLQYVVKIGMTLADIHGVNKECIEIACLLHDIGRGLKSETQTHEEIGYEISKELLRESPFTNEEKEIILSAILHHNSVEVPSSMEEKIVRTADSGSKVEYHEAFMLMCKKETYKERLEWGIKYLEKGYLKICLPEYKELVTEKYNSIKHTYTGVCNVTKTYNV